MDEKYMIEALKEAKKAYKKNEVPIGAVIVKNGKIIARAHNQKDLSKISVYHAEVLAIIRACKKLKNWRLIDCNLYVTMEPCLMCCGAIIQSRIKKIVYGVSNDNFGKIKKATDDFKHYNIEVISNVLEDNCKDIIQKFFNEKRK